MMSEVMRYHVQLFKLAGDQQKYAHGALGAVEIVRASDLDRVTAERDALQLLLNDRDEQLHTLEQSRRSHFDNAQAAERRIDDLLAEIATVRQGPCKMIVGDELP